MPTRPEAGDRAEITGVGNTAKGTPPLETALTVTTTFPELAPEGTCATMALAVQLITAASVPLKVTVLFPCADPKFAPVMLTNEPTGPEDGERVAIVGVGMIVKGTPLLAAPFAVTTRYPVVAPAGTGTRIALSLQLAGVTAVPLNVTVPGVVPKFDPLMVTPAPTGPAVGETLAIMGGGITVNSIPLLASQPSATITLPVIAPLGTGTVMLFAPQLVGVAILPLKVTVLLPCAAPKPDPAIVTAVPDMPVFGDMPVIVGPL